MLLRVKSVSLFRFTMLLQGHNSLPFSVYNVKQGQIGLPFPIYNVITGSNQSPLFDLQCYYKVKSVSLFRFTMLLQGQIGLPFPIYNVITGSNQSPLFDLQCYYKVKSVSLFRFTMLLQGQIGLSFRFTRFLQGQIGLPFSIYNVFTVWHDSFSFRCTGISHNIYQVVVDYFIYLHVIYGIFWQYLRYIYMILPLEPLHFTGLSSIFTCSAPNIYTSFTVTFNIL